MDLTKFVKQAESNVRSLRSGTIPSVRPKADRTKQYKNRSKAEDAANKRKAKEQSRRQAAKDEGRNEGRDLEDCIEEQDENSALPNNRRIRHVRKTEEEYLQRYKAYKEQKKQQKAEEMKKKKPVFKVGVVHHPIGISNSTLDASKLNSTKFGSMFSLNSTAPHRRQGSLKKSTTPGGPQSSIPQTTQGSLKRSTPRGPQSSVPQTSTPQETTPQSISMLSKTTAEKQNTKPTMECIPPIPEENEDTTTPSTVAESDTIFKTPKMPLLLHRRAKSTGKAKILSPNVCVERGSTGGRRRRAKGLPISHHDWFDELFPETTPPKPSRAKLTSQFDEIASAEEAQPQSSPVAETMTVEEATVEPQSSPVAKTMTVETAPASMEPSNNEEHDVPYFRRILKEETERLTKLCEEFEEKMKSGIEISEDVEGQILSVIGKGRLLMDRKGRFQQFSTLVDNCEFGRGEQETTCQDLQGFWDMIYYQVEDIDKMFADLRLLESKGWVVEEKKVEKVVKKKIKVAKKPLKAPKAQSGIREMMAAKRRAMKEAAAQQSDDVEPSGEPIIAEPPGSPQITKAPSPRKGLHVPTPNAPCSPKSLHVPTPERPRRQSARRSSMREAIANKHLEVNSPKIQVTTPEATQSTLHLPLSLTPFALMRVSSAIRRSLTPVSPMRPEVKNPSKSDGGQHPVRSDGGQRNLTVEEQMRTASPVTGTDSPMDVDPSSRRSVRQSIFGLGITNRPEVAPPMEVNDLMSFDTPSPKRSESGTTRDHAKKARKSLFGLGPMTPRRSLRILEKETQKFGDGDISMYLTDRKGQRRQSERILLLTPKAQKH